MAQQFVRILNMCHRWTDKLLTWHIGTAEAGMKYILEVKNHFDAECRLLRKEIRSLQLKVRSLVEENMKRDDERKKFKKLVLNILFSGAEKPSLSELPEAIRNQSVLCKDNELRNETTCKSGKEESSPLVLGNIVDSHMKKHPLISSGIDVELSRDCNISSGDDLNWIKRVKLEAGSSGKVD
ncbi:hypothetical protein PanWU01x14_151150 [Parasponia andersonii]|uniref:Uncharacterized protein n=1 Tax=Parasponia andersonii TaxID=3476 RepID=A0A2P5CI23_PARAD|nr:hypothetical protein PanWU01x14_151150 [Parasponia andersonii]